MWALPATKEAPKGDEGEESRVAHSCFFFVFRPPVFTPLFLHTPASDPAEHRERGLSAGPTGEDPGFISSLRSPLTACITFVWGHTPQGSRGLFD